MIVHLKPHLRLSIVNNTTPLTGIFGNFIFCGLATKYTLIYRFLLHFPYLLSDGIDTLIHLKPLLGLAVVLVKLLGHIRANVAKPLLDDLGRF